MNTELYLVNYKFKISVQEESIYGSFFQDITHYIKRCCFSRSDDIVCIRELCFTNRVIHQKLYKNASVCQNEIVKYFVELLKPQLIAKFLKLNNYYKSINEVGEYFINKINEVYNQTIFIISTYIHHLAKVKETSNAITDQFVAKCIRACLRSTFFDGANFYQDNQTRHTLIEDVRVKSIKDNLSLADNRKVLKFLELELDYLKCYEQGVANRDYIDSPQWRFFLNETIENYKEQLPKPGKLNFNFTIYDNELNDIYTFLISNKLIDTSRKEFRKVLVEQEGKINWIDSSKKLAVLISILSTRTILFSGFRNRDLQEFVICYFTINKKQIKEMSYLIKNKKELADNKVRLKYHNTLIQILNFIPSVYQ